MIVVYFLSEISHWLGFFEKLGLQKPMGISRDAWRCVGAAKFFLELTRIFFFKI